MPVSSPRNAALALAAALLAGCGGGATDGGVSVGSGSTSASDDAPAAAAPGADLAPVALQVPDGLDAAPLDTPRQALVPSGWSLEVVARIPEARLPVLAPDGALLVSVPSDGTIRRLTGIDGGAATGSVMLEGLEQPHGLAFAGTMLHVAESDQVVAYDYVDGAARNRRVVAGGLPDAKSPDLRGAYSHALKSVTVGPDGAVYFSIGSTGNISVEDRTATPQRATIMRVPPGGGPAEPFSVGVRNGTGLATAPDGAIWSAVNNRDNIAFPDGSRRGEVDQAFVNDNPPESIAKLYQGRELGWPFCNPAGGPANLYLVQDVQTNPDNRIVDCATLPRIEQSMGAHSAPLGMSFGELPAPFGEGALIGVHGSWNRVPPRAPEVSFYPWRGGGLEGQQTLVGGFQADDGSRWGRPVGAVAGPGGVVYITDDDAGAVYRLAPPTSRSSR